jgi:hypothetical protein
MQAQVPVSQIQAQPVPPFLILQSPSEILGRRAQRATHARKVLLATGILQHPQAQLLSAPGHAR